MPSEKINILSEIGAPRNSIKIENASSYGKDGELYFDNIQLVINPGDRVAIIGSRDKANTELMRYVAYEVGTDIVRHPDARILYVPQRIEDLDDMTSNKTVKQIFFDALGLTSIEARLEFLYESVGSDPVKYSDELGHMLNEYERLGGYGLAESNIAQLINGLNVNVNEHDNIGLDSSPINASSGQRKKLLLARAIFSKPSFLLLNNPSAHLDAEAQSWLSKYIANSNLTVVVSGGDTNFIEGFANRILKLSDSGVLIDKQTRSLEEFQEHYDSIKDTISRQKRNKQNEIDRLAETRKRLASWAYNSPSVARRAAVTSKRIEKARSGLELLNEIDDKQNAQFIIPLTPERRTGDIALKVSPISIGYSDKPEVVKIHEEIIVTSSTRLRIAGRNGSGKSTLIKAIVSKLGNYEFDNLECNGDMSLSPQADLGIYFPEQPPIHTDSSDSVYQSINKLSKSSVNCGKLLKYWGFEPKNSRDQKVSSLQNTEEIARFNMLALMVMRPNILILDEPTGNLTDIYKTRLIKSIEDYSGTIIYVSHDNEYNEIIKPSKILMMPEGKITDA